MNSDASPGFFLCSPFFLFRTAAVSGCPYKERNDPGNLELDWLEVQLEMYRKRGMQVITTVFVKFNGLDYVIHLKVWLSGPSHI